MQVARVYYPVETLGYGRRLGIWTVGCPRRCRNCSNPELQVEDPSQMIEIDDLREIIQHYLPQIDGITITGGDPLFQSQALHELLTICDELGVADVLVYTGYTMKEISESSSLRPLLSHIGVLIDGPYIEEKNDSVGIRGSSNQKIYILNKELEPRYKNVSDWKRKSQTVIANGIIYAIGIPIKSEN